MLGDFTPNNRWLSSFSKFYLHLQSDIGAHFSVHRSKNLHLCQSLIIILPTVLYENKTRFLALEEENNYRCLKT
jgi:hypothetical protein